MRNRAIDVYKFIFCCIIAIFHFFDGSSAHMIGGNIGVEFFVMAAGLFFFKKLEREMSAPDGGMDSIAYIKKRFLRFFPYTTAGLLLAFLVKRVWLYTLEGGTLTGVQLYKWFSRDIWDYLLVSMGGLNAAKPLLNGPIWTVSAMLICELLIWGLYRWNKQLFRTVIAPAAILFVLGYWKNMDDADYRMWLGFTTFGTMRVFGDYCLALFIYEAAKRLRAVGERLTTLARSLLTVCEFFCLALSIVDMELFASRYFRYVNMLLFCVALVIGFSGQSFSGKVFRHEKVVTYLGALSLSVYIVHYPILNVFRHIYPEPSELDRHFFLFMAAVLVCSVIFDQLLKLIIAGVARLRATLKPKLVVTK